MTGDDLHDLREDLRFANQRSAAADDMARLANSRIDGHEELCSVRHANIMQRFDKLDRLTFWVGGGVVTGLFGLLFFLIFGKG